MGGGVFATHHHGIHPSSISSSRVPAERPTGKISDGRETIEITYSVLNSVDKCCTHSQAHIIRPEVPPSSIHHKKIIEECSGVEWFCVSAVSSFPRKPYVGCCCPEIHSKTLLSCRQTWSRNGGIVVQMSNIRNAIAYSNCSWERQASHSGKRLVLRLLPVLL